MPPTLTVRERRALVAIAAALVATSVLRLPISGGDPGQPQSFIAMVPASDVGAPVNRQPSARRTRRAARVEVVRIVSASVATARTESSHLLPGVSILPARLPFDFVPAIVDEPSTAASNTPRPMPRAAGGQGARASERPRLDAMHELLETSMVERSASPTPTVPTAARVVPVPTPPPGGYSGVSPSTGEGTERPGGSTRDNTTRTR